jgi:hypothetical protein
MVFLVDFKRMVKCGPVTYPYHMKLEQTLACITLPYFFIKINVVVFMWCPYQARQ